MAHLDKSIETMEWQICTCCGRRIKQLGDFQSMIYFLDHTSVQRRGFQCMNCGQVTCYDCSRDLRRCSCGSNAWVAMPYLDKMTSEAMSHSTA